MSVKVQEQVSLKEWTSWQVGGAAEFYAAPTTKDELIEVFTWAQQKQKTISVLGQGSNVLVSDRGVPGLVIHMKDYSKILETEENESQVKITCESGVLKSDLLKVFMKKRLAPALFLAGLPGDIGGGVVMNAGIGQKETPREFCEIVHSVEVLRWENDTCRTVSLLGKDLNWEYRKSKGWQPGVISTVTILWENSPNDDLLKMVREGNSRRKRTQPLHLPSCGSVFKNPQGNFSGKLIEESGLKGFSIGGAQVSEKHANFIVNNGGATAQELHEVMSHVQSVVQEKFDIRLTNEVVYMGQW